MDGYDPSKGAVPLMTERLALVPAAAPLQAIRPVADAGERSAEFMACA